MATVTKPIALDESFNTTEVTPRNIADVLAEGLSHITGRTASEVEYDNTESGLTADNVQEALDEIVEDIPTVPSVDIQTAVDEFSTYNGGLLSSLKVALSPNQDLHGYENPWVGGAGKNKAPLVDKTGYGLTFVADELLGKMAMTGTATGDGWGAGIIVQINLPVGSYICSATNNPNNAQVLINYNPQGVVTSSGVTINVTDATQNIRVAWLIASGTTYNNVIEGLMIRSASETDPTFEPYSNICPISGHTQVEVGDEGKNLYNKDSSDNLNNKGLSQTTGDVVNANGWIVSPYIVVKGNQQYTYTDNSITINYGVVFCYYDSGKNFISSDYLAREEVRTIQTPANAKFVRFEVYNTATNYLQFELGSTKTAYVPYNGYQVTVNLGGTYYSGTLDVVSGVFVPDTAFDTLSADNFNDSTGTSGGGLHFYDWNNGLSKKSGICLCSMMPQNNPTAWASTTPCIQMASGGGLIRCYVEEATKEAFKTAYSGMQIVYELDTSTPIQLSPTMVKALVGENHLSAPLEGQEITESKYKQMFTFDDVIAYIQSLS